MPTEAARHDNHGRLATKPTEISWQGWWEVGRRVARNVGRHNMPLIAAGVALFSMLAIFPALNVAVSLYALFSSPENIISQIEPLQRLLPGQAFDILTAQLADLSGASDTTLNLTLVVSVLVGLWVSRKGAGALITACNIVYDEYEKRSFWGLMFLSLLFTVIGVLGFVALGLLAILLPIVLGVMPLGEFVETVLRVLRWPILAVLFILVLECVYRFAPSRKNAQWRWVSVGAVVATMLWVAASVGFTVYVQNFANYNKTYGAIGSVIILILWFYLSAFVVLLGAEINAEMEHQTTRDSTVGPDQPMGQRGAHVADTVGTEPSDEKQQ
jgi:membrane protein